MTTNERTIEAAADEGKHAMTDPKMSKPTFQRIVIVLRSMGEYLAMDHVGGWSEDLARATEFSSIMEAARFAKRHGTDGECTNLEVVAIALIMVPGGEVKQLETCAFRVSEIA